MDWLFEQSQAPNLLVLTLILYFLWNIIGIPPIKDWFKRKVKNEESIDS